VVTFSGIGGAINGIPAAELNASFVVTVLSANTYQITTPTTASNATDATSGGAGIFEDQRPFVGNILDAVTVSQPFLGTTGTSDFTSAGLTFTITTSASGTSTFTYTSTAPNSQLGQFNNLTNLVSAINNVSGLTARIVNNRLYIGATDATAAVTIANGSTIGTDGPPVQAGIDWVRELGLQDIAAASNRFSTMQSLADLVNLSSGISATVSNPLGAADVAINVDDPLDTITFTDGSGNTGSMLGALGLAASLNGGAFVQQTTGALGPAYDPTDSSKNMASGSIPPQFSRPVTVFDGLGSPHNLNIAFLKTGINSWAVEVYAQPETDVNSALPDGMLAYGPITFNGDGTLRSVDTLLSQAIDIVWTNGSTSSSITFNWGTAGQPFPSTPTGLTDGLGQFDSGYNVNFVNQNGAPVGQLTGISIDQDGFITASYNNGETQRLYKIPLASFTDPNHLQSVSGNAFLQTTGSGVVNLRQASDSGVGTISSGALEASNVELARQLTDMIVAQRAYQANTKVISTADQLLSDLDAILR
jgi:flagellar hook protein FlgE